MIGETTTYYLACDGEECRASTIFEGSLSLFGALEHGAKAGWRLYCYTWQPTKRHKPRHSRLDYCPECVVAMGLEKREAEKTMSHRRRVDRFNGERWVLIQEASNQT